MTLNKEDYLKQIYHLGGREKCVANKEIAESLQITSPSVSEMIKKLSADGLVTYTAYKGVQLTDTGTKIAISMMRSHRLWEVFLIRHLNYSWSDAHEDAELLEHIAPDRLITRLDAFLNFPKYCPHGSAIPTIEGQLDKRELEPLSNLNSNDSGFIRRFVEERELLDYLETLKIEIGSQFQLIDIEPYEGSYALKFDNRMIKISHKAATKIFVEHL